MRHLGNRYTAVWGQQVVVDNRGGAAGIIGTPNNLAVWDKLNDQCIPNLFPSTGAPDWGDVDKHQWTVAGAVVPYNLEARIWVDTIKDKFPNGATVALLETDNDFGKTYDFWLKRFIQGTNIKLVAIKLADIPRHIKLTDITSDNCKLADILSDMLTHIPVMTTI